MTDWRGIWQADGTLGTIGFHLQGIAELNGLINWERASMDGTFVAGEGGKEEVKSEYEGKGLTLHCLADRNGMLKAMTSTGAAGSDKNRLKSC